MRKRKLQFSPTSRPSRPLHNKTIFPPVIIEARSRTQSSFLSTPRGRFGQIPCSPRSRPINRSDILPNHLKIQQIIRGVLGRKDSAVHSDPTYVARANESGRRFARSNRRMVFCLRRESQRQRFQNLRANRGRGESETTRL